MNLAFVYLQAQAGGDYSFLFCGRIMKKYMIAKMATIIIKKE